jgi:5-methylcytosine-specific restriction enzyme subunit McrC
VIVSVREHACLTTAEVAPSLDLASVSEADFDWLVMTSARLARSGASLVEVEGRRSLRLDNYVGVVETPSGTQIEIVPKHAGSGDRLERLRALVLKMVGLAVGIAPRILDEASLKLLRYPVSEWLALQFLQRLEVLIRRGIRFDYRQVEEEGRYLRGQLNVPRQVVQPIERQHLFQIRHDVFTPDRPENRLLKLALDIVNNRVLSPSVRRLANQMAGYLHELQPSQDVERDLSTWRETRLMAHYADIRPWCELIVLGNSPFSQAGQWRGLSLLFPMEKLFERYVAACLRRHLAAGARLTTQAKSQYLCRHRSEDWFMLQPDLLVEAPGGRAVLDTKWKILDAGASSAREKYGLSQADFYQLFAYGSRYLEGSGEMFLIFPSSPAFCVPLPSFEFSGQLRLWAVPFDLEQGELVGGEWVRHAAWFSADAFNKAA